MRAFPVTLAQVRAARDRIRPFLPPTPLRRYPALDDLAGRGITLWVKHENHQPTNSFKVRNGLAALTALPDAARRRGVVAASRGTHGLGLAYAGSLLGIPVAVCVPRGNNPEKNEAMRALGAQVVEAGRDYDASLRVADRYVRRHGRRLVHATNDREVLAGAGTLALEMLEQEPSLEALVFAVGGGSQAVGGLIAVRGLGRRLPVFAVQAAAASAIHDSWRLGRPVTTRTARTIADGLATRSTYAMTFPALREGLAGFVTVTEAEIAEAMRTYLRVTHNLAEGAGAAGLAGALKLRDRLAGRRVGIVLSGGNVDAATLRRILR